MFCTKCGAQIDDDSTFCVHCGEKIDGDAPQDSESSHADNAAQSSSVCKQSNQQSKTNKPLIIAVIAAAVVIVIVACVAAAFALGILPGSSTNKQAQTNASTSSSANSETKQIVDYENSYLAMEFPASFSANLRFSSDGKSVVITNGGTDTRVAEVYINQQYEDEGAHYTYSLGKADVNGTMQDVYAKVYLVDDNNKIVHWAYASSAYVSTQKFFGLSPEDFLCYVMLKTPQGLVASTPVNTSQTPAQHKQTSDSEPFWGIWLDAYKDYQTAAASADKLRAKGYDAQVVTSTDWSNLNSERWECVTAARCATQAEAQKILDKLKGEGYSNAYVKYSGNHK